MQEILDEQRKKANIAYKHKLMHEARVLAAQIEYYAAEEKLMKLSELVYKEKPSDEELTEINAILEWLENQVTE
jgi:hypothetical protein